MSRGNKKHQWEQTKTWIYSVITQKGGNKNQSGYDAESFTGVILTGAAWSERDIMLGGKRRTFGLDRTTFIHF
jgi:hypothetical protein